MENTEIEKMRTTINRELFNVENPDKVIKEIVTRYLRLEAVLEQLSNVSSDSVDNNETLVKVIESRKADVNYLDFKKNSEYKFSTKYKLAVTDLFVETAIQKLEEKARDFHKRGSRFYSVGIFAVIFAVLISGYQLLASEPPIIENWFSFSVIFSRAFTFYGLFILSAVVMFRYARAMLDQAERLQDRRHALRQGRLFVHLHEGKLDIDELDRAFSWNVSQNNAFSDIATESKAPWGALAASITESITKGIAKKEEKMTK
jgi:hypothetical protein